MSTSSSEGGAETVWFACPGGATRFGVLVLTVFLLVVLEGCGFRLRGAGGELEQVPPVFVRGEDPAALELRQFLRTGGVEVVDRISRARLVLDIEDAARERRVLSVGSRGRVQEYELVYRLQYRGEDREGRTVLDPQAVVETRDFSFDETDVVAKSNEEDFLFREMQRSAVMQIMRRLQVVDFSSISASPVPEQDAGTAQDAGTVEDAAR